MSIKTLKNTFYPYYPYVFICKLKKYDITNNQQI